ncbi:hypothetical protein Q0V21_25175 [Paenibacillus sp. 11B]|uniref:hypothetical protein n=1 Tax=unclassified Paenibacillus TaxID=185978 RepID=UPI0026562D0B|nr:hypothetical protein [Paenibacillus sp. 11B]MDN8592043.1 hypothetical protein [Paenibacillus sp. 11B]
MNAPQLLPMRDLIKDELGNYYVIIGNNQDGKIILVNAVVFYASNRIVDKEYFQEHAHETLTHAATEIVKRRIEDMGAGKIPGGIYKLETLKSEFGLDFVVDGLYERNAQAK